MPDVSESLTAPLAEDAIMRMGREPRVHEFWMQAGEVKNLKRELARLKQEAAKRGAEA